MSSPLSVFRKYQYLFLVALGVLLMFAFVIAPPLADYLGQTAGEGRRANTVVATWKHGKLREGDLEQLNYAHRALMNFLQGVMVRTQQNGGSPKVAPLTPASSEEELVVKMLLAQKAEDLGMVVSEDAMLDYLDLLADHTIPRHEFGLILRDTTRGQFSERQMLNQLQSELMAQRMSVLALSGVFAISPGEMWDYYNRLNRRVVAELLPIPTSDFTARVPDPSDVELRAFFERHKNQFPFPSSPEPGFRRREQVAFSYVKADFNKFLDEEKAKVDPEITDADIEKYYQDNKEEFRIPELPEVQPGDPANPEQAEDPEGTPDSTTPSDTQTPPGEGSNNEKSAGDDKTGEDKTGDGQSADDKSGDKSADDKSGDDKSGDDKSGDGTNADDPPAKATKGGGNQPLTDPAAGNDPPDAQPPQKKESADGSNGSSDDQTRSTAVDSRSLLVSYQEDDPGTGKADPGTKETESGQTEGTDAPPAAGQGQEQDQKQGQESTEPPAKDPATSQTPPVSNQDPPQDPNQPSEPTTTEPVPGQESNQPAGPLTPEQAAQQAAEPKYKPLDDELRKTIRDRIATERARAPAVERMLDRVKQVRNTVDRYSRDLSIAKALERKPPSRFDLQELAERNELEAGKVPLTDLLDLSLASQTLEADDDPEYYELARATEMMLQQFRTVSFVEMAFREEVPLFKTQQLNVPYSVQTDFPVTPDAIYVFWRTKIVPEYTPKLEDVRGEVVDAWKKREALQLVRQEADKLAAVVRKQSDKALAESLDPSYADRVIVTNPFSWMTLGSVAPGGGQPTLSSVTGSVGERVVTLENVGPAFMENVFDLAENQVGTAVDQNESTAYVVRLKTDILTREDRRQMFLATGPTNEIFMLARRDQQALVNRWYEQLEKEMRLEWKRDPVASEL